MARLGIYSFVITSSRCRASNGECAPQSKSKLSSINLSGLDAKGKVVLLRCEDAGGILGERARRTVRIIEIQSDLAVLDRLGVIVTARRIRFFAAGEIPEFNEQPVILFFSNVELIRL